MKKKHMLLIVETHLFIAFTRLFSIDSIYSLAKPVES